MAARLVRRRLANGGGGAGDTTSGARGDSEGRQALLRRVDEKLPSFWFVENGGVGCCGGGGGGGGGDGSGGSGGGDEMGDGVGTYVHALTEGVQFSIAFFGFFLFFVFNEAITVGKKASPLRGACICIGTENGK